MHTSLRECSKRESTDLITSNQFLKIVLISLGISNIRTIK